MLIQLNKNFLCKTLSQHLLDYTTAVSPLTSVHVPGFSFTSPFTPYETDCFLKRASSEGQLNQTQHFYLSILLSIIMETFATPGGAWTQFSSIRDSTNWAELGQLKLKIVSKIAPCYTCFSNLPAMIRSVAYSKSQISTAFLSNLAAWMAASLQMFAISAPEKWTTFHVVCCIYRANTKKL